MIIGYIIFMLISIAVLLGLWVLYTYNPALNKYTEELKELFKDKNNITVTEFKKRQKKIIRKIRKQIKSEI